MNIKIEEADGYVRFSELRPGDLFKMHGHVWIRVNPSVVRNHEGTLIGYIQACNLSKACVAVVSDECVVHKIADATLKVKLT